MKRRLIVLLALLTLAPAATVVAGPKGMEGAVKMWNGRPTIFVNGQAEMPQIYALTDFRGGRFTWEEIPKRNLEVFTQLGFKLFQVDVWFQDIWTPDGKLNMDLVRRQIKGVVDVNPQAAVFIRFHVNAPFWWNRLHPTECVQYANGPADGKDYGPPWQIHYGDTERHVRHSLASQLWQQDATAKLKEMLSSLAKSAEGRSVVGLQVAGGVYGEWHPWGFPSQDPDVSAPMHAYFRRWLQVKYKTDAALQKAWNTPAVTFASATVPDLAARDRTLAGLFRDVNRERQTMDYYEAQQDNIADDILHFCEVVKTSWPRPIITGAFYGYYFSTFGRQAAGAHLRMNRIFDSKWIDYVSAPQSYFTDAHEMGGAGQSRGLVESGRLAGKLFLDEMDTGTSLRQPEDQYDPNDAKLAPRMRDDVALLRRNTLHPLLRGHGLWYYDFGAVFGSGSWDNPLFHDELKRLRGLLQKAWAKPYEPAADVLVVYDPSSVFAIKSRWNTVNDVLIDRLSAAVYRSGAMADFVRLDDLPRVQLDRYKAVLFAHTTRILPAERAFIRERVATAGRHLLWTYMPGYFDGETLNEAFSNEVTGVSMQRFRFAGGPKDDPTIVVDGPGAPRTSFALSDAVDPMMEVVDAQAQAVAHLQGTTRVVVAKKSLAQSTTWVGTLSLHDPALLRFIFRQAGAHIYNDANDSVLAGMNLLMVHSATGGKRTLTLRNQRSLSVTLPPRSTSLFDAESGENILPNP